MFTKLHDILRHGRRDEEGGISAEYIAVIVIVAAVIAAVWAINIQGTVGKCGDDAVRSLFSGEEQEELGCETE